MENSKMEYLQVKRKAAVRIVGSGTVGTAIGKGFLAYGINVASVDASEENIFYLKQQGLAAYPLEDLRTGKVPGDITFLSVPTPTCEGHVDISYIEKAARDVGESLRYTDAYHVVVVKSTVPPGTTEEVVITAIEEYSGKQVGTQFGVCMNPEYLREKSAYDDFIHSRLVVIGEYDTHSGDVLQSIYQDFPCPIVRMSLREAEMQKYVHNLFNATKISFFNEMRAVCQAIGADADKIFSLVAMSAEGIWNSTYGMCDKGPFDGKCLPKDTEALFTWAQERGIEMKLLGAIIQVNEALKQHYEGSGQQGT